MRSRKIELRISDHLLAKIDQVARQNFQTRSDYIRGSIVLRLNDQRVVQNQNEEDKVQAILDQTINLPDD